MTHSNAQHSRTDCEDGQRTDAPHDESADEPGDGERPAAPNDGERATAPDEDERTTAPDDEAADEPTDAAFVDDHLRDVEPGAGCTEIWEYLSERRDE